MFLVVGLGNPGEEYAETPHNMGFLAVDRLADNLGFRINRPDSKALVGVGGQVMIAKPQTYMNLSGTSVKALMAKHEIAPQSLILAYDELDLPWGEVRVRPNGRPRGHNGVRSVAEQVGTEEFARVRLGVQPGHPLSGGKDYLLSRFSREQTKELDGVLELAAQAIGSVIADGVEKSMAKFNRRAAGLKTEDR